MNYVYDPKNQAQIAAEVNYITPVKGVQQVFEKTEPELAKNPLIFPTEKFTEKCFTQPPLSAEELQNVTRAFNAVVNG
jgi:spermidine/putrescine transport system substrate-binding protein